MIGGEDIVIHGAPRPDDWGTIVRFMSYAWPEAIVEDANSGDVVPIGGSLAAPLGIEEATARRRGEFFVYKNGQSLRSWEESGATEENGDDMIHFLMGPQTITCVVGHLDSPSAALVDQLCAMVERKRRGLAQLPAWWGNVA